MVSDSQQPTAHPDEGTTNKEAAERDKRVAELLDDQDLRKLLIQDSGHVAKNPACTIGDIIAACGWPQFNGQFPGFLFSALFWGPTAPPMATEMNIPLPQTSGSTSVSGQHDSSSVHGQDVEREEEDSVIDNEDKPYPLG